MGFICVWIGEVSGRRPNKIYITGNEFKNQGNQYVGATANNRLTIKRNSLNSSVTTVNRAKSTVQTILRNLSE